MNGLVTAIGEVDAINEAASRLDSVVDLLICPPATLISAAAARATSPGLAIGGQTCHADEKGAHTGDVSAEMIADAGATAVIVGHSERRADHGETDDDVAAKAAAAHRAGLIAIICVGETESQRNAGQALDIVAGQIDRSLPDGVSADNTVIAYEPVWAIGTGRTPTADDVAAVHAAMRTVLGERVGQVVNGIRLLYGGSIKPSNAAELLSVENVDGALVGGASLKAADFLGIAEVYC